MVPTQQGGCVSVTTPVLQDGARADQTHVRRPGKRMNSPERWEITQLIKAGVLDVTQYPHL